MNILKQIEMDFGTSQNRGQKDDTLILLRLILEQYTKKNSEILDLGCGTGSYHSFFDEYRFIGVDKNDMFTNNSNSIYYYYDLEDLPYKFLKNKFNNIICLDTIEHLYRPDLFLKNIYNNLLEESGLLYLSFPNSKCLDDKLNYNQNFIFDPNLKQMTNNRWTAQHIRFFDMDSVKLLCQDIGFNIKLITGCNFYVSYFGRNICEQFNKKFQIPIEQINRELSNCLPMLAPNLFFLLEKSNV